VGALNRFGKCPRGRAGLFIIAADLALFALNAGDVLRALAMAGPAAVPVFSLVMAVSFLLFGLAWMRVCGVGRGKDSGG
jgi:hypothetical protein